MRTPMTDADDFTEDELTDADRQRWRRLAKRMRALGYSRHPGGFWVDPLTAMKLPESGYVEEDADED